MDERDPDLLLLQFPYSHYNEKVRWGLDLKRIPHRRKNLLPGPHAPRVLLLTGRSQTPVLLMDGRPQWESARILELLERRWPEPSLLPADPRLRARALALQERFDREVGPLVRRALFATLLDEPAYVCGLFSIDRALPVRRLYRALFPVVKGVMKRSMGITSAAAVEEGLAATRSALDFVAEAASSRGPLLGDRFSVADLTAAALLAPCVNPPGSPMQLPEPLPAAVKTWLARWRDHPGSAWVRRMYREHRAPAGAGEVHSPGGVRPLSQATAG